MVLVRIAQAVTYFNTFRKLCRSSGIGKQKFSKITASRATLANMSGAATAETALEYVPPRILLLQSPCTYACTEKRKKKKLNTGTNQINDK